METRVSRVTLKGDSRRLRSDDSVNVVMICFLFPGQSSWRAGMMGRACSLGDPSARVLDWACEVLGRDLRIEDAEPVPHDNRHVQVGVFVTTLMHLAALEDAGLRAETSLGLSLGEYAHLRHVGALDDASLLGLVDARGTEYDRGPSGKMVAVFPLDREELEIAIRRALGGNGGVEIANVNSPTQHVIAGDSAAVDRVVEYLLREHYLETRTIEEPVPMHTSTFEPVAYRFRRHLERAPFRAPRLVYRPNVTGSPMRGASAADVVRCLTEHVHRPVQWRASVEACVAEMPDVTFVEVGPGNILSNLLGRRWIKNRRLATDVGEDLRATFQATVGALRDA